MKILKQRGYIVVFIGSVNSEESRKISRALLERRQAGCVTTMPGGHSEFWWRDKLESAETELLVVKTKESLLQQIIDTVKEFSSDEVPEVIALPIAGGNRDYLDWLNSETA